MLTDPELKAIVRTAETRATEATANARRVRDQRLSDRENLSLVMSDLEDCIGHARTVACRVGAQLSGEEGRIRRLRLAIAEVVGVAPGALGARTDDVIGVLHAWAAEQSEDGTWGRSGRVPTRVDIALLSRARGFARS